MSYIPGKKNELMEIDRLYESISSFSFKKNILKEGPEYVDKSKYKNIDFRDRVVGNSAPSKDKINPSLLADVDKAAGIAKTKASITTAVTGHRPGSRHELGLAVDVAMFDGKGYSGVESAKKQGIYDTIVRFVKALESLGYKVNTEKGQDKAVLWFGFKNHHHHVHISRKSDDGVSASEKTKETEKKDETKSKEKEPTPISDNFCQCMKNEKNNSPQFKFLDSGKKCDPTKSNDEILKLAKDCLTPTTTQTSSLGDLDKLLGFILKEDKVSKKTERINNIIKKVL